MFSWSDQISVCYNWKLIHDFSLIELRSILDNVLKSYGPFLSKTMGKEELMLKITSTTGNNKLWLYSSVLMNFFNEEYQTQNYQKTKQINNSKLKQILIHPRTLEEPGFIYIDDFTLKYLYGLDTFKAPFSLIASIATQRNIIIDKVQTTKNRLTLALLRDLSINGPVKIEELESNNDKNNSYNNKLNNESSYNVIQRSSNNSLFQLQSKLQSYGLPTMGSKELLIARLLYYEGNLEKEKKTKLELLQQADLLLQSDPFTPSTHTLTILNKYSPSNNILDSSNSNNSASVKRFTAEITQQDHIITSSDNTNKINDGDDVQREYNQNQESKRAKVSASFTSSLEPIEID